MGFRDIRRSLVLGKLVLASLCRLADSSSRVIGPDMQSSALDATGEEHRKGLRRRKAPIVRSRERPQRIAPHPAIDRVVEQLVLPQIVNTHRQLGIRGPCVVGSCTATSPQCSSLPSASPPFDSTQDHNRREASWSASGQGANLAERYLEILLRNRPEESVHYVEGLRGEGLGLGEVYLGLLAPVARMLGERWLNDTLNFSEVTLASWQLEQVLRHFAGEFEAQTTAQPTARATARTVARARRNTLLVALLPGEQHTFGARMLVSFFRRSGWDASLLQATRHSDITGALASRSVDVLALSLSQREALADLAPLVRHAREASLKPELRVLVGGRAVIEAPERASTTGASVCTGEADEAVELASRRDN